MSQISRKESLEIQAGADALLTPGGGGVAVWVRRDELMPRVAIRFNTAKAEGERVDVLYIATILATLRIGVDRATHALADNMGVERDQLAAMVEVAHKGLAPHYETATNIVR